MSIEEILWIILSQLDISKIIGGNFTRLENVSTADTHLVGQNGRKDNGHIIMDQPMSVTILFEAFFLSN